MTIKTKIAFAMICILLYTNNTTAMLIRNVARIGSKKAPARSCSSTPIKQQPINLKKLAAQQFVLKEPLPVTTLDTILAYNQDQCENLYLNTSFSAIGTMTSVYPLGLCVTDLLYKTPIFPSYILPCVMTMTILNASLWYHGGKSLTKRRNMIKALESFFRTHTLCQTDRNFIQITTQEDIQKNINKTTVFPETQFAIPQMKKTSDSISHDWNINKSEILKHTLQGKYNRHDYNLYLEHKE